MTYTEDRVGSSLLLPTAGRLAPRLMLTEPDKVPSGSVERRFIPAEERDRHPVRVTVS